MSAAVQLLSQMRLAFEHDLERLHLLVADLARADPVKAEELAKRILDAIERGRQALKEALAA